MTLIVAIEPDRRQANYLSAMVRHKLKAELMLAGSAEVALRSLDGRVPDVILTSALLSPKDESLLADWFRTLDTAAAHIQTLTIPVFSSARPPTAQRVRGMFASFMGSDEEEEDTQASPDGCDPALFAEQCADYLERARAQRASNEPEELFEPAEAPRVQETPEPVVMVQAMKPTEVIREAAPAEFVEFDLSRLIAESDEPPSHGEPESTSPQPLQDDEAPAAAPSSDIWIAPRLAVERRWPKMEIADARSAVATVAAKPAKPQAPARRVARGRREKPIQDEWGFFDPEQCGFAALLAKLQEITERDDPPAKRQA